MKQKWKKFIEKMEGAYRKKDMKELWCNNKCSLIVGLLLLIVGGLVYSFCKETLWTDTPTKYQLNLEYKQTLQVSTSNEKQTK